MERSRRGEIERRGGSEAEKMSGEVNDGARGATPANGPDAATRPTCSQYRAAGGLSGEAHHQA
jgi:hypothetical protein